MAIQDVIKRLIWQFSSTGADQVAADMGKVNAEQDKLAVNSQETSKATLDLEASFDKLERRFDTTIKAQQDYAKVQAQVNAAVAQHPELQERANNVLELAAAKFEKASEGADTYSKLLAKTRESLAGFAAEGGPVGALLGSFGPWGVAAAAGLGLVTKALDYMNEGARKMGETSDALKNFSDNIGLTITQLRGVTEAGAGFGLAADKVGSAMEKFTVNLGAAREGSGTLYDGLALVDKGLADDVAAARSTAQAFDAVIKAINSTADATVKLNIAKAAFGKGAAGMVGVAGAIGDAGGMNAYSDAAEKASGVTSELIVRVAELKNKNEELKKANDLLEQSLYSEATLKRQQQFLEQQNKILLMIKQTPAGEAAGAEQYNIPGGLPGKFSTDISATAIDNTAAFKAEAAAVQETAISIAKMANEASGAVGALGNFATAEERATAQILALQVALEKGKIDEDQYNRSADAIRREADAVTELAQKWGTVHDATALQLESLNDQLKIAKATTEAQKEAAQKAADYGAALRQTGDAADATQIAIGKAALRTAQATAAANQWADSLRNAAIAAANASSNMAAGMSNFLPMGLGGNMGQTAESFGSTPSGQMGKAWQAGGGSSLNLVQGPNGQWYTNNSPAGAGGGWSAATTPAAQDLIDKAVAASGSVDAAIVALQRGVSGLDAASAATFTSAVEQLYGLKISGATGNAAKIAATQQEIGYLQGQPGSLANLNQITSLQQSLDQLTQSTNSLNATNQELLSPYYTTDPRTSHIGFRSQGMAAGGYVDVPGGVSSNDNMLATIPVASGERIYVDPMNSKRGSGGNSQTININVPIAISGNANKDEIGRTVYQNMQIASRQIAAATR